MQTHDEGLSRAIGTWGLSANMINIVVGAGIFALPALVASSLGNAAILAYVFCGIVIALIMFCFAEVGSRTTISGGPYAYIETAFGKYFGFLALCLYVLSAVTADAAVANALVGVLASFIPGLGVSVVRTVFFILLFGGLAYLNVVGVRKGIGLVKFTTLTKLTPLLLVVIVGWIAVSPEHLAWQGMPGMGSLAETSLLLFFAFQGAETGLIVGGEIRNPTRTVPKAILIAITGVLILYILVQVVAQGVLGSELPLHQDGTLSVVGQKVFGPIGFALMTFGATVSMFGNLSGEILNLPRMVFRSAVDKVIPIEALGRVHPKFKTPYVSIIIYASIGCILAIFGGFGQLALASSAAVLLIYFGVAASTIRFRRLHPKEKTTDFRIPGGYLIPTLAMVSIVGLLSGLKMNEMLAAVIAVVAVSVIYIVVHHRGNIPVQKN